MPVSCPKCHSKDLRYAKIRNLQERVRSWFGYRPLRCRECRTRFIDSTWHIGTLHYARCPRCWRMDLRRWSPEDYFVPLTRRVLLALGGSPYRCEYCRLNFISFRKRKERYRGHRGSSSAEKSETTELVN